MEGVTLLLAVIGCLLVIFLRPIYGLAVYVILAMWYPYCVGRVSVGTIDFSVARIVILALFAKVFTSTNLAKEFKFIWLDKLIVILFVAEVVAGLKNIEAAKLIEYRSGDFFDMALPYFAVRLIVKSRDQYISLLKAIAWSVAGLSLFGFYESLTGHNLLSLGRNLGVPEVRLRIFHRAQTTFRVCIYFGVFCAMVGTVCMGLLKYAKNTFIYVLLVGLLFLGAFSSMSSGAQFALIGSVLFIAFYRFRHYWKTAIIGIILMCGIVEIISNRHFYDVIDRFALNSATAWYRNRLWEVAFLEGGMNGHWVFGYGFDDPRWCDKIDYRDHTDLVNHYLMKLARYGLIGFVPFCAVIVIAIKNLFKDFWSITSNKDTWLIWSLAGGLFSVLFAFNSVSLFGQPMIMLFMIYGFCIQVPEIVSRRCPKVVINNR